MTEFKTVPIEEAHRFGEQNGIFSQTKYWAKFRSLFRTVSFVGTEDGTTVLSGILYRLPIYGTFWSVGYMTRGFVCDWTDTELVRSFTEYLKHYCKKHRIIYVILDPWCDRKVDFQEPEYDVCALLEELGYQKNEDHPLQPKTNYRLNIDASADPEEEKKRIYSQFADKLTNGITSSRERGVTAHRFQGNQLEDGIRVFYRLLLETTEKKGFGHRDEAYYQKFAKQLEKYVTIYLWKYHYETDTAYTKKALKQAEDRLNAILNEMQDPKTTPQRSARLEPRRKDAEEQLTALQNRLKTAEKYKDDPYISAAFYIKVGNKAYNLYGANAAALRELKLSADYWDMIEDSIDGTVTSFNMGGTLKLSTEKIKDDPLYDLYLYKKRYGGEFVEMPGEYHLILDQKKYEFFHNKLNYFRRIIFRF